MDYTSPKQGHCQRRGCHYHGEVSINSDYEFLCPAHMQLYLAQCRRSSFAGKVSFLENEIKRYTEKIAERRAEMPLALAEAKKAEQEYEQAKTFAKLSEI